MRRLTIVNRSPEIVNCHSEHHHAEDVGALIFPGGSATLELKSFRDELILTPGLAKSESSSELVDEKDFAAAPDGFRIRAPLALGAIWKAVDAPEGCPWVIYRSKVRGSAIYTRRWPDLGAR